MIISLLLLFVIATFAMLNPLNILNYIQLQNSGIKLISDLKLAKLAAYSKGTDVNFYFIKDKNSNDFNGYLIVQSSRAIKRVVLPNNVKISRSLSTFSSDNKLVFNANGSVSPYACSVVLKDIYSNKTEKITLTIGFSRIAGF
ncbi:hypothetical protein ABG79_01344 [Caloramator mitchellensis]|uniref:General secretion pathway GspH domain-containing protein n=1 Tax=Caloramator mitchellensis TaxID=908809 RepID=A0A0R3K1L8_CALMK|nr:hypothetical protein [Caloramator mitchellensis]KRQ86853.1 hypothetical protein ABG79_01344 [Caloramator mitchellensis]